MLGSPGGASRSRHPPLPRAAGTTPAECYGCPSPPRWVLVGALRAQEGEEDAAGTWSCSRPAWVALGVTGVQLGGLPWGPHAASSPAGSAELCLRPPVLPGAGLCSLQEHPHGWSWLWVTGGGGDNRANPCHTVLECSRLWC